MPLNSVFFFLFFFSEIAVSCMLLFVCSFVFVYVCSTGIAVIPMLLLFPGIGTGLALNPMFVSVSFYFERYRGFACGIIAAGSGAGMFLGKLCQGLPSFISLGKLCQGLPSFIIFG